MEIWVLIFSTITSFLITMPTITIARRMKLITDIKRRMHPAHTHKGLIPRAGGVPIFLTLLIGVLLFLPMNKILLGILISSFILMIIGLLDDYYDLSPYFRFAANIFISALVIGFGLGIPFLSNPFGGVIRLDQWVFTLDIFGRHGVLIIADILAALWLSWIMNMVNWSKGVDGQLPGFVAITAFLLAKISS